MTKIPLVIIVGPTAVGKTALSIEVAKRISGEIISGDAIQVYRGMDVGSAKITPEETEGVPHHLIDILSPDESYSAAAFKNMAEDLIRDIHARGHIPMIVGGTGLYIQSVIYEYGFSDENPAETKKYEEQFEQLSPEERYTLLEQTDPLAAADIHPNNQQRVLRALVYYHVHGQSITQQSKSAELSERYDMTLVGLNMERSHLYDRINQRVDMMVDAGLIEEVERLKEAGYEDARSMTAIGYKEIISYLNGHLTLDEALSQLKQNSRRFAKRQLTWFRNQLSLTWYDTEHQTTEEIVNDVVRRMTEKEV
ncbi:tRNA (adenosine(37)-N6)-dimethylallyltransferase MiaA [Macrococcus brunensis]|uniref:tRNA (adenosine(37)-N6)-dimethylallyltransferase MiaA n=1 Tax=Macrococcus brunensis TaxID=198483 RepID=UPI001EEFAE31|nr:tRNA (adenosine(37)-N6)-dimethylallyltransferase MiaA [Macrococcus brunensis]ULG72967.1 tRNA (adenosine(37)-N6)-dimethylallyltransferase MiaA [Macrococcus brunensis]